VTLARRARLLPAVLCAGLAACPGDADLSFAGPARVVVVAEGRPGPVPEPLQGVYSDGAFFRRVGYGSYYRPRTLTLEDSRGASEAIEASGFVFDVEAPFDVVRVRHQNRNVLWVMGTSDAGETVVERWVVQGAARKRWGVSAGGPLEIRCLEVWRGTSLSPVREMGVDPDGRFLLFLHGEPLELSTLSLDAARSVTRVVSSAELSWLEHATDVTPLQHRTEGRLWFVFYPGLDTLVLHDAANDATFERWEIVSFEDYERRYFPGPGDVWADNFTVYRRR